MSLLVVARLPTSDRFGVIFMPSSAPISGAGALDTDEPSGPDR